MKQSSTAKLKIFSSMFIFGTIGLFVRYLSMPSSVIALARGIIGVIFLSAVLLIKRSGISWAAVRKNLLWLCLSGSALGFNWILLFESYRYTSVAVSTLCYYMAPIFIILCSPFILHEKLSWKKALCVLLSLLGMVCISGVLQGGVPSAGELTGILLGLAAAVLYAAIVMMNKQIHQISAYDKTIMQLGISAILLVPYCLLTGAFTGLNFSGNAIGLLLLVGVVHTGFAYFLYFGAMDHVSGQTAAMISYLDPVIAVLASVLILKEPMDFTEGVGAVLILGAALLSEINLPTRKGSFK